MKKNNVLAIFIYLITIFAYASDDYNILENVLLNRGYIKFDPKNENADYIYDDCYYEIFHEEFIFSKTGTMRRGLDMGEGFIYRLYYVLERNDLPNLLAVVYLENNGKLWGFYKKNLTLDGTKIYIESPDPEDYLLVFF